MTGRRAKHWVAAGLCALALVAVGARYLWLHEQRLHTEESVAGLTRRTTQALHVLRRLQTKQAAAELSNTSVQAERDRIRAVAAAMHDNLSRARADTTAAEVGAYVSGAQANNLRACLTGVSQALNQLAVGDGQSLASLQAVDAPCRAAGIV
ncbi:MAG: hypothetical protein ACXVIM_03280 [Acidimicrobiia bacterium]